MKELENYEIDCSSRLCCMTFFTMTYLFHTCCTTSGTDRWCYSRAKWVLWAQPDWWWSQSWRQHTSSGLKDKQKALQAILQDTKENRHSEITVYMIYCTSAVHIDNSIFFFYNHEFIIFYRVWNYFYLTIHVISKSFSMCANINLSTSTCICTFFSCRQQNLVLVQYLPRM